MKVYGDRGDQVGANKYRMVLYGNASIEDALAGATDEKGNKSFQNKCFNGNGLAQGSVYIDVTTVTPSMYDEENDTWNTKS